ncbi:hypothetical protein BGP79_03860 [Tersicoccus sp. Bi-70]|nr:hypothetical protein BGP79_03860 [Tersicoccus sp. Bi-70]
MTSRFRYGGRVRWERLRRPSGSTAVAGAVARVAVDACAVACAMVAGVVPASVARSGPAHEGRSPYRSAISVPTSASTRARSSPASSV